MNARARPLEEERAPCFMRGGKAGAVAGEEVWAGAVLSARHPLRGVPVGPNSAPPCGGVVHHQSLPLRGSGSTRCAPTCKRSAPAGRSAYRRARYAAAPQAALCAASTSPAPTGRQGTARGRRSAPLGGQRLTRAAKGFAALRLTLTRYRGGIPKRPAVIFNASCLRFGRCPTRGRSLRATKTPAPERGGRQPVIPQSRAERERRACRYTHLHHQSKGRTRAHNISTPMEKSRPAGAGRQLGMNASV